MGRVEGKVALITGAARGQGRAHAVRLAEEGADIVAVDLCAQVATVPYPLATPDDLAETAALVERAGRRVVAVQADVRDLGQLRAAVDEGLAQLGALDVVVANAGIISYAPATDLDEQTWRDVIDVDLTGAWLTCRAALPALVDRGGGSIVLVGSSAGLRPIANAAHYVAAKHGVVGLARALAVELAPHGIRVNSVHPTAVLTGMIANDASYQLFRPDLDAPVLEDTRDAFQARNALLVPWIEPRDVANAVLWLASDESRYVTGIALPVDAGSTQRP